MAEEAFDTMVEVEAWLNSKQKDYVAGIALFKQYGDGGFLLDVLQMGETAFNRQKLLEAITSIRNAARTAMLSRPSKSLSLDDEGYGSMAPAVLDVRDKLKHLYKLNGSRKGQLHAYLDQSRKIKDPLELERFYFDNKTGDLANIILDTEDEITQLLEQFEYGKVNNSLPPAPSKKPEIANDLSYDELLNLRNNLRSKKSKAKNKPEQLELIGAQLKEVERRINGLV